MSLNTCPQRRLAVTHRLSLLTVIMPVLCMKSVIGVSPVSTGAHFGTLATGTVPMAATRRRSKPQALEWLFSAASGTRFHISVDNLSGCGAWDENAFRRNVRAQADYYLEHGMPARAGLFFETLKTFYGTAADFNEVWKKETRRLMPDDSATDTEVD